VTEAEYTFRLHKPIIPLRLECRYYPDGWLGILCGNNLVYDFSVPAKHADSFDGLMTGLSRHVSSVSSARNAHHTRLAPTSHVTATHERTVDVTKWCQADVDVWLDNNDLKHLKEW